MLISFPHARQTVIFVCLFVCLFLVVVFVFVLGFAFFFFFFLGGVVFQCFGVKSEYILCAMTSIKVGRYFRMSSSVFGLLYRSVSYAACSFQWLTRQSIFSPQNTTVDC